MEQQYFLATTALEEFWDTEKPIIFLGKWCLRFDRRQHWDLLSGHQLDSYIQGSSDSYAAYRDFDETYERILPHVAKALNVVHGTNHSLRYWRICVGPWLQLYITAIMDRYRHITNALESYPNVTTVTLSEEDFVVPQDTNEFNLLISGDMYNLQIFSKIFLFLGKNFPNKSVLQKQTGTHLTPLHLSWRQKVFTLGTNAFRFIVNKLVSEPLVFNSIYLPKTEELRLTLSLFFKVFTTSGMRPEGTFLHLDDVKREELKKVSFGEDDLSRCLSSLLFYDLPKCFVEGYSSMIELANKKYPSSPKLILSANAWWYDEVFKFWAADCAEKGIPLLGMPHGGDVSLRSVLPSSKHEKAIVDYYYSWDSCAEEVKGRYAKIIQMPATKLINKKRINASNKKTGILWVTTSAPRYGSFEFPSAAAELFEDYLCWHQRFISHLSQNASNAIVLRSHPVDYGWNLVSRIEESFPSVRLNSRASSFEDSINSHRLYVCDHLSTTYAEALAANLPTILFWSQKDNKLTPHGKKGVQLLSDAGIFFNTPEAAAVAVSTVYDDVESWWNEPKRQNAIRRFMEAYCQVSPNAVNLWTRELQGIALDKRSKTLS
jgi:putative transferase (TIGR04331 family)